MRVAAVGWGVLVVIVAACGASEPREASAPDAPAPPPPQATAEPVSEERAATDEDDASEDGEATAEAEPALPPPGEEELAAARAFVEELVARAAERDPEPPLGESVDWPFVTVHERATGHLETSRDPDRPRWTEQLRRALRPACDTRFQWTLAAYERGAAGQRFDLPAEDDLLTPTVRRTFVEQARQPVARSLVVSVVCLVTGAGYDVLLRRQADGGFLVRGFRRRPRHPMMQGQVPLTEGPPRACESHRWGGWEGDPACRRAARRRIRGADRRCRTQADCVVVGTECDPHGVNRAAAARYRRWLGPCRGPGEGGCGGTRTAVCDDGCCVSLLGM